MTQLQEESIKNPLRYLTSGFAAALNGILENTAKRWDRIAEEMRQQCADKGKSEIKKYPQKKTVSYRMIGYMRQPLQGNSILMKQMPDVLRIMVPLTVKNDHAHRLHGQLPQ